MSTSGSIRTDAEFTVLELALRAQLSALWGADGPCSYREVRVPNQGAYVRTPKGRAVGFTVLGREFTSFIELSHAERLVELLRGHGVYSEPATPNSDRQRVYLGIAEGA